MVLAGPDSDYYFVVGDALYVGKEDDGEDYWSLYNAMNALHPNNQIVFEGTKFDTYWKKAKEQSPEPVNPSIQMDSMLSVLLNNSTATHMGFVNDTVDEFSIFGCLLHPLHPCLTFTQFLQTFPRDDDNVTDTAIPRYVF